LHEKIKVDGGVWGVRMENDDWSGHYRTSKLAVGIFTVLCLNTNNSVGLEMILHLFAQALPLPWQLGGKI
jgi:hypothetical protein